MRSQRAEGAALAGILLATAIACGPAVRQSNTPTLSAESPASAGAEGKADRIQAGDLAGLQGHTAADAIRQLRPEFLRPGGNPTSPVMPAVYVNRRYAGGLEVLDLVPLSVVIEIRQLNVTAAKSTFGSYCPCDGGVILVQTRN